VEQVDGVRELHDSVSGAVRIHGQVAAARIQRIIKPWVIAGGTGGETFFPLGLWRGARIELVPLGHLERPRLVTEDVGADETHFLKRTYEPTHVLVSATGR
jgi:hypothetical protein